MSPQTSFSPASGALAAVRASLAWAGIRPRRAGYFISSMSEWTTAGEKKEKKLRILAENEERL